MSVYVSPHHYTNMKSIFIQQFLGSSFVSPALGGVGQGRLNINNKIPPKKSGEARKQAGKKERYSMSTFVVHGYSRGSRIVSSFLF